MNIHFPLQVLVKLVTNPYPYTDKAADLVQEASILQVNIFKQDVDNVSIPISHIDGMPLILGVPGSLSEADLHRCYWEFLGVSILNF